MAATTKKIGPVKGAAASSSLSQREVCDAQAS